MLSVQFVITRGQYRRQQTWLPHDAVPLHGAWFCIPVADDTSCVPAAV